MRQYKKPRKTQGQCFSATTKNPRSGNTVCYLCTYLGAG